MSQPRELGPELGRLFADQVGTDCGLDDSLAAMLEGRLDPAEKEELERHIEGCPTCREVFELARQVEPVWEQAAAPTEKRTGWFSWLSGPWFPRLAAAAAAVLVLVVALVWTGPPAGTGPSDRLIPKGVPAGAWQVHVAAEVDGRTFRVADGARLPTGARLGFFYTAARAGFLMVLYADESGQIVRLVPARRANAMPVAAGRQVRLADGAVLSPGEGCEWVVALFASRSFTDAEARAAVDAMLAERRGCQVQAGADSLPEVGVQVVQIQR